MFARQAGTDNISTSAFDESAILSVSQCYNINIVTLCNWSPVTDGASIWQSGEMGHADSPVRVVSPCLDTVQLSGKQSQAVCTATRLA